MKILAEILKKEGIKSKKDLFEYIEKKSAEKSLNVVNSENQKSFSEKLKESKKIIIQNTIVDLANLDFLEFESININNCIFTGKVNMSPKNKDNSLDINIEIENSIFIKEIIINNIENNSECKIAVYNSNISYLDFINIKAEEIIINHSKIFMLDIHNVNSVIFEAENNKIEYLEVKEYNFNKINFDFKQINKNYIKKRMKKMFFATEMKDITKIDSDINLFEFIKFYNKDFMKEKIHSVALDNLIKFVKEETNITKDKKELNELMFWEIFFSQKNPAGKFFVWITKAFIYPGRFLILGAIILVIFSIIYAIPTMEFNVAGDGCRSLKIGEAVYFAGVTFTTVGYGDISPVGISRIVSVVEAVFGIITMNAFMVALLKKYVD